MFMIEMWNDDAPDSTERCVAARVKVEGWLREAGITVIDRFNNPDDPRRT